MASFRVNAVAATRYFWFVEAIGDYASQRGPTWTFSTAVAITCRTPAAPTLTTVSSVLSGNRYTIRLDGPVDASSFVLEESKSPNFDRVKTLTMRRPTLTAGFEHDVTRDTVFYYRALAQNAAVPCNLDGLYSETQTVVVRQRPEASFHLRVDIVPSLSGVVTGAIAAPCRW